MIGFADAFDLDAETGLLWWRNPPSNRAGMRGKLAGYLLVGKGKNKSYWQIRFDGKTYRRGRVVFYMTHGRWPEPAVDHANGNSLDDRPVNLRECTLSQNAANSKGRTRARSDLPKGVYNPRPGRFMARLTQSGTTRSLGTYSTVESALEVYLAAKKEAFGDFA